MSGVTVRDAGPGDAPTLAALIVALGYEASEAEVAERLARAPQPVLVAVLAGAVVGCASLSVMRVLHRPRPVGRVSMMVVREDVRGRGIGAALVAAAEARLAALGCGLVEVTSNMKRTGAHAFYERLGYARTSYRFAKALA